MKKILPLTIMVLTCSLIIGFLSTSPTTVLAKKNTTGALSTADKKFITTAAQDGLMEVQMAQAVLPKLQNEDVKAFAQKMVTDHTAINTELASLAQSKNVTIPTELPASCQKMIDKLVASKNVDTAYMKDMVAGHKKAVALFTKESTSGSDADVKAFAAKTLPTLQEHQTMANDLAAKLK